MHVPSGLGQDKWKSVVWPEEPGSAVNFVEATRIAWHGISLDALREVMKEGFLRGRRSEGGAFLEGFVFVVSGYQ